MGNICCANGITLSPESKHHSKSALVLGHSRMALNRNLNSFESVYHLDKNKLGYGSYGDVKLCTDKQLMTCKAVKIINKDYLRTSNIESSWFYSKIDILNRLDHPLIVRFHEFFEECDFFYLLMDYHQEGDLLKHLKCNFPLKEDNVCSIIYQLLIAVAYMHNKKIAHRDLKLENILITTSSGISIKVIDFDTAAYFEGNALSGKYGTYHYMAPETMNSFYNEKCDVWSLGVIMYIILTGRTNLPGMSDTQSPSNAHRLKLDFSQPLWQKVSAPAKNLLKKLLEKEPIKRVTAVQALDHLWFKQLSYANYDITLSVLDKIFKFNNKPLIRAAKKIILHLRASKDELTSTEKAFLFLDKDYDGEIYRDDILNFYLLRHTNEEAEEYTTEIMRKFCDFADVVVSYSAFVEVATDEMALADSQNLRYLYDLLRYEEICRNSDTKNKEERKIGKEVLNVNKLSNVFAKAINIDRDAVQTWADYLQTYKCESLDFDEFSAIVAEGISN